MPDPIPGRAATEEQKRAIIERAETRRVIYWCTILSGVACGVFVACTQLLSGEEPLTWLIIGEACAMILLGVLILFIGLWVSFKTWWKV
jgi:hypothetical protein